MMLAVKVPEVATPDEFVVAVEEVGVAEAPEVGVVKVTVEFGTGLPKESVTVAVNLLAKVPATVTVCPPPEVAARLAGAPALKVTAFVLP